MPYAKKECKTCGRIFQPSSRHSECPMCRGKSSKRACPSCGNPMHKNSKQCKECSPSTSWENNPNWRGGISRHSAGYVYIRVERDGVSKYVFEHVLVMEEYLGRRLLPDENVHHKNGIRDDNRITNLELWVRPQPAGIRAVDALVWAKEMISRYEGLHI